ncbi:MAG TPA: isoprenylcysteine carboxylmethyltransferase family protein [Terriglobia bacterium]|nr:isoprenylcysteine carboxylmethyltransferase family protein [Terriglobia bacterium]
MRATEFEFRYRLWILVAIFVVALLCYSFDRTNVSVQVAEWLIGGSVARNSPVYRHLVQALFGVGAALLVLAALIRTWATAYLSSDVVHDSKLHTEGLVADGPYRYVRNPLYLGSLLMAVGFSTLASRTGFFVLIVASTIFYYRLIRREESALLGTQGKSYLEFLATVPRLVPSLKPRAASGDLEPRWGQAWLGEAFAWLLACAMIVYTLTLSVPALDIIIIAAFAQRPIVKRILEKNNRRGEPLFG